MSEPTLSLQQEAVVKDRGGTLLVSAAAGSGKTKVLVDRVMKKIQTDGKNINEFLIITFTNAAASELRGKISQAIAKALSQDPKNRHLQRQLNLISLAQISTVHAFCGNLIRQYGYLLEIPSDYTMLEDAPREEMLTRILEDILEESYEKKDPGFLLLANTLGAGRNDSGLIKLVQNLFEKLLSQPNPRQWLRQQQVFIPEGVELRDTNWGKILLEDGRKQLSWIISRYDWAIETMQTDEKLISNYLPQYEGHRKLFQQMLVALEGPWDEIKAALNTIDYSKRVVVRNYPDPVRLETIKAVKADGKERLLELQKRFARPQETLIREQNELAPALEALLALVEKLYTRFSQEKRRKNKLDFSDQEHLAIELLLDSRGEPSDVALAVREQYTEIMVDEYQDSNQVQELIYCAISKAGDQNRFLVGDVKQSIYGFRQAQPEIFIEKYSSYCPGEQAQPGQSRYRVLSSNFRSRPEILEAVNHVFETVMTPELGGLHYDQNQRLYPGLPTYPQDGKCHVELDILALAKLSDARDDESTMYLREARWVANRIVALLEEGLPVRDGDGLRPVQPQDIAILFRSRTSMSIYQRALRQAGLPVASDTGEKLFETPEANVLLNLLRVLDNPHQDVPLLSVLSSPMFRMGNETFAKIHLGNKKSRFYDALMACQEAEVQPVKEQLLQLKATAKTMSAEALVWYLIYDGGLMTAYSAMEDGESRKNNLLQVYDMARNAAGGSYLYLHELVQYLEWQAENGVLGSEQETQGITLTTIHKSKGLEYPVVFLSDLAHKFNFSELSDKLLVDGEDGLGAMITDLDRRVYYSGLCSEALKVKKHEKLLSEELRVLYVAMTRPKDYLFMTYSCGEKGTIFQKLLPGVGRPCQPWAGAEANCLGDWILLAAMSRIEAGEIFSKFGRPPCELLVSDFPWKIQVVPLERPEVRKYLIHQTEQTPKSAFIPSPEGLTAALSYRYPYAIAAKTPSKLTATELKGRNKDQEAAEDTTTAPRTPQLTRPDFILEKKGLTPTEKGTATHLFLQYADYTDLASTDGVIAELDRLVDGAYITPLQAEAIAPDTITRLFSSPLGQRLQQRERLIREFKFSMLWDGDTFYPDLEQEQVLLQGVVDAAIVEEDGLIVLDFKTDRVAPGQEQQRAEAYRSQLMTYKQALQRIFQLPVKETLLYFLATGETVSL